MITPNNPAQFWNERYNAPEYAYGVEPNRYFQSVLDQFQGQPGRMLLPAEGEGRNAVYAALKGWQVTAVDFSEAGCEKAMRLAEKHQVQINYQVMPVERFDFKQHGPWDAVGLVFAHFAPHIRPTIHQQCVENLVPGGMIVLEAFNKQQLAFRHQSGGPADEAMLYDPALLHAEFAPLAIQECQEYNAALSEGYFHQGEAALIRMLARRV